MSQGKDKVNQKDMTKQLSRRERQIMDIIYQQGSASVSEVHELMSDPPGYSAVRAQLSILEKKGHLKHKSTGPRYVYFPTLNREQAKRKALSHIMQTFFDNSTEKVVTALLDLNSTALGDEEFKRLSDLIEKARGEGR